MVACYPSPAGATESLLELETWEEIRREHPVLAELEPDVQALLVNRVRRGAARRRASSCRSTSASGWSASSGSHWKGFTGGTDVWEEIDAFLRRLAGRRARHGEGVHA